MERRILMKSLLLFPIVFPFIFNFFIEGMFEEALEASILAELIVITVFAVFFKRSYCGFFCLIGTLQKILKHVSCKLFKKRLKVPAAIDKYLRLLKYFLLAGLILLSFMMGRPMVDISSPIDQYNLLFPAIAWIGGAVTVITIAGSLVIDNFFCKYLCVRGAMIGAAGRYSPSRIMRNRDKCVNCKQCTKNCPMNLEVHGMLNVAAMECLNCQSCIAACPKQGALTNSFAGKGIPFVIFVSAAVLLYLLVAYLTTALT